MATSAAPPAHLESTNSILALKLASAPARRRHCHALHKGFTEPKSSPPFGWNGRERHKFS